MLTKVDISSCVGFPDSPVVPPGISGEISSTRMVKKMINYFWLTHLFEVESKISLNTRIPLIFKCSQVNFDVLRRLNVDHEIRDGCAILFLKALVDT